MQVAGKSHYILVTVKAAVDIPVRTYYLLPGLPTSHLCFPGFIFDSSAPTAAIDDEMLMGAAVAECLCFWKMQPETLHEWIRGWNGTGLLWPLDFFLSPTLQELRLSVIHKISTFLLLVCSFADVADIIDQPALLLAILYLYIVRVSRSLPSFQDMLVKGSGKHNCYMETSFFYVFYI